MQSANSRLEVSSTAEVAHMPVARWVSGATLVFLTAATLFVGGFASDLTLVQPVLCIQQEASADPLVYGASAMILAVVFWVASRSIPGHTWRRSLAKWLIAVSSAGAVIFVLVALLSLGFASSSRGQEGPDAVGLGVLVVLAFAGQSIAALGASILVFISGRRAMSPVLPASVFLIMTAVSAIVPLVASAVACS